jgi:exonuclease III
MSNGNLLLWNANGVRNKFVDLDALLTSPISTNDIAVVAIVETKMNARAAARLPDIAGYITTSIPGTNHSGGLMFLVKDTLQSQHLSEYDYISPTTATAAAWLSVRIPTSPKPTLVAVVYAHPTETTLTLSPLLASLTTVVEKYIGHDVFIMGDFNCHDPHWGDHRRSTLKTRSILNFLAENHMNTLNQSFMRGAVSRYNSQSVIDLIITNRVSAVETARIASELGLFSDHFPIVVTLQRPRANNRNRDINTNNNTPAIRWYTSNVDWLQFKRSMVEALSECTHPLPLPIAVTHAQQIIDAAWGLLQRSIITTATRIVPTRRKPGVQCKRWWSYPGANLRLIYCEYRRAIRRCYRHKNDPQHKAALIRARLMWRTTREAAEEWELREYCDLIETRPHIMSWRHVRRITQDQRRLPFNSIVNAQGDLPSSVKESLNNMADTLVRNSIPNIESPIAPLVRVSVDTMSQLYTSFPSVDCVDWTCSVDEVEQLCQTIDTRGAPGCDDIHPLFLRHSGRTFYEALCIIFNYSYRYGVIPAQWNRAVITAVYKGGDRSDANSYRPISITCIAMRLMEQLIHRRLVPLIDQHIHPFQYGFRAKRSTMHAAYHLTHDLRLAARGNTTNITPVAFLDLKKAFDRVWHDGLLYALARYGIVGRMWMWLRAFLDNRYLTVTNGECMSDWRRLHHGVPQGAVLSPTLFITFANLATEMLNADPATCHPRLTLLQFADDNTMYPNSRYSNCQATLQIGLDTFETWSLLYQQEVQLAKSKLVLFSRSHPETVARASIQQYSINGVNLPEADNVTYLGMCLSKDFSWNTHYERTANKLNSDTFRICTIVHPSSKRPIHFNTMYKLCVSYLRPRSTYGLFLIPNISQSHIQLIQSRLCSAIRSVLALPESSRMLSVCVEASMLPMMIFYELEILKFAHSLSALPQTHAARQGFDCDYARSLNDKLNSHTDGGLPHMIDPPRIHSFGRVLLDVESRWLVHHTDRMDRIKHKAYDLAYRLWSSTAGLYSILTKLKLSLEPSYYLRFDTAANARLRARFRFDRIGNNSQMFRMNQGRHRTTHTPMCIVCQQDEENVTHMIEDCPLYCLPRTILQLRLVDPLTRVNASHVLGVHIGAHHWTNKSLRGPTRLELLHTATFLRSICRLRGLATP